MNASKCLPWLLRVTTFLCLVNVTFAESQLYVGEEMSAPLPALKSVEPEHVRDSLSSVPLVVDWAVWNNTANRLTWADDSMPLADNIVERLHVNTHPFRDDRDETRLVAHNPSKGDDGSSSAQPEPLELVPESIRAFVHLDEAGMYRIAIMTHANRDLLMRAVQSNGERLEETVHLPGDKERASERIAFADYRPASEPPNVGWTFEVWVDQPVTVTLTMAPKAGTIRGVASSSPPSDWLGIVVQKVDATSEPAEPTGESEQVSSGTWFMPPLASEDSQISLPLPQLAPELNLASTPILLSSAPPQPSPFNPTGDPVYIPGGGSGGSGTGGGGTFTLPPDLPPYTPEEVGPVPEPAAGLILAGMTILCTPALRRRRIA
ncbi:MAG: hypothetical protein KDA60_09780 [Planctomycetales bacterium]|nr:hypothetical protein [Planctomycetales bacterium]